MRLIDADALGRHLNDIWLSKMPSGTENIETQTYKCAVCEGLRLAMDAVDAAPTVEPEPVTPIMERVNELDSLFRCGDCGAYVLFRKQTYCHSCGRKVKWDG